MIIEIYELRPGEEGFVINDRRLLCIITVKDGKGSFNFLDSRRERLIRGMFEGSALSFVDGGTGPGGIHVDSLVKRPAWSREAVEAIVNEQLFGSGMGGKIIDEE
jgi:hypothetical protein